MIILYKNPTDKVMDKQHLEDVKKMIIEEN